ncbi:MAG: AbrB/MazE/SpoVT family DNA-binding domain-containing protein [Nanoarchaeota archaeon]
MDVTKLSTKGQIVIPEKIRKHYKVGASFIVSTINDVIVLKPIKGLSPAEQKELKEITSIWNEIDSGKADTYAEKEFFKAMKQW